MRHVMFKHNLHVMKLCRRSKSPVDIYHSVSIQKYLLPPPPLLPPPHPKHFPPKMVENATSSQIRDVSRPLCVGLDGFSPSLSRRPGSSQSDEVAAVRRAQREGGGPPPHSSPSPPSILLQRRLIAVGCGANSESKAAGALARAGGCPLAGVNGSGVEWVGGWRMSENKRTFQPGCLPVRKTGVGTAATLPKCVAIFCGCIFYALRITGRKVTAAFHSPDDLVRARVWSRARRRFRER